MRTRRCCGARAPTSPTSAPRSSTGAVVLTYVRSPFAHARVGVDRRRRGAGVARCGRGLHRRRPRPRTAAAAPAVGAARAWSRHLLAADTVRYVGEPVAIVVAETSAQGEDAAELVIVDYDPLDAIVDPERALDPDDAAAVRRGRHQPRVRVPPGRAVGRPVRGLRRGRVGPHGEPAPGGVPARGPRIGRGAGTAAG